MFCKSFFNLVVITVTLAYHPHDHYRDRSYPQYYDYDQSPDPAPITFDGIYQRRKKFDVETPMGFPTETQPDSEHLNDDQLHNDQPSNEQTHNEYYPNDQPQDDQPYNGHSNNDHSPNDQNNNDYSQPQSDYVEPSPDYHKYSADDNNGPPSDPSEQSDDYPQESQTEADPKQFLSDGCLRCLCEASSDCDPQVRCHVEGPSDYNCGPFQLDVNYWNDAGSPGADQNDPSDFEDCVNDIECAIETVNGYMKKNTKDCDGDGKVSCDDYAKIHKAGAKQCNSSWVVNTQYWHKYKECFFDY